MKNLDQEAEYIAKEDPQAAQLVVQRIQDTVALLASNPLAWGIPAAYPALTNSLSLKPATLPPIAHVLDWIALRS